MVDKTLAYILLKAAQAFLVLTASGKVFNCCSFIFNQKYIFL